MKRLAGLPAPRFFLMGAIGSAALCLAACERADVGYDPRVDGIMPQRAYIETDSTGQPLILGDPKAHKLATGGGGASITPAAPAPAPTPEASSTSSPAAAPTPAASPAPAATPGSTPAAPLSAPAAPPPPG